MSFERRISPKETSTMKRSSTRFGVALLALALLTLTKTTLCARSQQQNQATAPARSRADETLEWWNHIGKKLIAMAKDFPEDKYDFKLQKDERTFAENLLHVAAVDYDLMSRVSGSNVGPDFGKDKHNPSRDAYKTKADVVKLIQQAVADRGGPDQTAGRCRAGQYNPICVGNREARGPQFLHLDHRHRAQRGALRPARRLLPCEQLVPPESRR